MTTTPTDAIKPIGLRRLGRNTVVYSVGVVAQRVASVVLLPLYTRYLVPAQYGILQLLDITVEVTTIVFRAGTAAGLQRFFFKAEKEDERRRVAFTAFVLHMGGTLLGTVALAACAGLVNRDFLSNAGTPAFVRIAALNFLLSALVIVPQSLLQIEQKAMTIVIFQLIRLGIQIVLNVYFLVSLHLGVAAILWSTAVASSLTGIALMLMFLRRTGVRMSMAAVRDLRRFGIPYQVSIAASFILTFGDRFFLQHYRGVALVGLYALAYQFNFLLQGLASGPFQRAWEPHRFSMVSSPRATRDAACAREFLFSNLLLFFVAFGITVFTRPALTVLTSAAYHAAAPIVPVIIVAAVLQSWGTTVKFGIDVSEKTWLVSHASWIATVVIIVAYASLIPIYGAMGAAVATVLGYAVRFWFTLRWAQREWPVRYGWGRTVTLAVVSTLLALPAWIWTGKTFVRQVALGTVLTLVYMVVVWYTVLVKGHREALVAAIRQRSLSGLARS